MFNRIISFKLDSNMLIDIEKAASKLGISRSELIRLAIQRIIIENNIQDQDHINNSNKRGGNGKNKYTNEHIKKRRIEIII